MATEIWEYVVDTYYTIWNGIEDLDVELNRIASSYSGVWRDNSTDLTWCFLYTRRVSFGFTHEDVARMFISAVPKKHFGIASVSIVLSNNTTYKLDLGDFMANTG